MWVKLANFKEYNWSDTRTKAIDSIQGFSIQKRKMVLHLTVPGRGQRSVELVVTTSVYNYDEQSVSLSSFKVHGRINRMDWPGWQAPPNSVVSRKLR